MRTVFAILIVVGVAGGGVAYYATHLAADQTPHFRTVAIKRGDLLFTISATGTVEPEEVVDVGAQVAGRVLSFGPDPDDPQKKKTIDYGSRVHKDTVLAWIDDAVYKAQVDQAAALLQRSKADLKQLQAHADQTEQEYKRAASLRPVKAIADSDYDLAVANYRAAEANVAVGESVIKQYEAALELAKTNLKYTVIKSPVEGTIIDRRVNIGQTVVASLNAPSMFLIAKDLRRIQVWASVNEADIGRIHMGMPVRFTVDAYPNDVFRGKVFQIRLNATMTQNVVTYTVVVETDNSDGRLLPYLTANLQFEIEEHKDVLIVPNAALRWKPRPPQIDPEARNTASQAASGKGENARGTPADKPSGNEKTTKSGKDRDDPGRLWVAVDELVRPLAIVVGPSDGSMTEIGGSGVTEGMEVVVGDGAKEDVAASDTQNPFAPKLFGGRKARQ